MPVLEIDVNLVFIQCPIFLSLFSFLLCSPLFLSFLLLLTWQPSFVPFLGKEEKLWQWLSSLNLNKWRSITEAKLTFPNISAEWSPQLNTWKLVQIAHTNHLMHSQTYALIHSPISLYLLECLCPESKESFFKCDSFPLLYSWTHASLIYNGKCCIGDHTKSKL